MQGPVGELSHLLPGAVVPGSAAHDREGGHALGDSDVPDLRAVAGRSGESAVMPSVRMNIQGR